MTDLHHITSSNILEQAVRCIALADEADALIAMGDRAYALREITRAAWIDQATDATLTRMFALERGLRALPGQAQNGIVQAALQRVSVSVDGGSRQ